MYVSYDAFFCISFVSIYHCNYPEVETMFLLVVLVFGLKKYKNFKIKIVVFYVLGVLVFRINVALKPYGYYSYIIT